MNRLVLRSLLLLFLLSAGQAYANDGGIENLRQTGKAFASVARAVSPSVVFIQVEVECDGRARRPFGGEDSPFGDDLFRRFFGERSREFPEATNRRKAADHRPGFGLRLRRGQRPVLGQDLHPDQQPRGREAPTRSA